MVGNKVILLIIGFFTIVFSSELKAQKHPVFYGGFEYYRHTDFNNDMFGSFNAGAQVYQWKFLAPEVGFDFYFGSADRKTVTSSSDLNAQPLAVLDRQSSAVLLTLSPKIKLGKDDAFITISPKYHIGNLKAKGNYLLLKNNGEYGLEEQQKVSVPVSFWSFSVGVEGLAIRTDSYWFTLSLHYTLLDVEKAFKDFSFSEEGIGRSFSTSSTLGLGVRFYWDPFSN